MAAYAALVSLLNTIHQIQSHPHLSTSLDNIHIQTLIEKTNFLLEFAEGNNYGAGSKEAQDLERQIASAAHAAEDLIESDIVDQIHPAKDLEESTFWDKMKDLDRKIASLAAEDLIESDIVDQIYATEDLEESIFWDQINEATDMIESNTVDQIHEERLRCPSLPTEAIIEEANKESLSLQHIIDEMDAIIKEANEFKEKRRLREEQQATRVAEPLRDGGESGMVGLDAELIQLLDELTSNQTNRRIISIVGMGGTGKTTLAKNVYENSLIKGHFDFRAWATISQQSNAKEVLSKLVSCLGESSGETVDDLGVQLHKTLFGRRYLIVLDDIWSVTIWDEVKHFFPDNNNASRVLLTTRLSNVARDCGSSIFKMNLLDEENSWKLFCKRTFQNDNCPQELRVVGEKIVKLCKGLALSIVVIGGLLRNSPRTLGHWQGILENLASIPNSKEKQESFDVLTLSYNHLPYHLKPCFLYLGVFREDSQIRISKIIKLWVAEGFIKPIGSRVLEEIAEDFITDLIDRNLIVVVRRRKNGQVGYFGIHDLLRDLCIKLAEREAFLQVTEGIIPGTQRRVVDNRYIERTESTFAFTRSFITDRLIVKPIEFRLLRVLDENGYKSQLDFYGNVNLRYLSYKHPSYDGPWEFPTSISLMWNLQAIIIKHTGCLMVASIGFWNLCQLRHVECFQIYIPCPPPSTGNDELPILENLQTLKGTVNLRLCEEVCKIIPNIKKLHLAYDTKKQGYNDSWMECLLNLDRLHKLESLSMSSCILSGLSVSNRKKKCISSLPNSLKKLCLSWFQFHWDDLTKIGSLAQLEVLELGRYACEGGQWSPNEAQFRCLKFLKIETCGLSRLDADESNFPVLEKLILIDLLDLEEIPLRIGEIPTLELIRVDHCSNSAAVSAVKIKEDQLELNDDLQVQVRVPESKVDSFNQMLETEGLTVDNIQLEI